MSAALLSPADLVSFTAFVVETLRVVDELHPGSRPRPLNPGYQWLPTLHQTAEGHILAEWHWHRNPPT